MNPAYDFRGQVALVTGASSGMGRDTVRAFAAAGAAVVLADINEGALRVAADELTAAGHQALAVTCDVSDEAQVAALVERALSDRLGVERCAALAERACREDPRRDRDEEG